MPLSKVSPQYLLILEDSLSSPWSLFLLPVCGRSSPASCTHLAAIAVAWLSRVKVGYADPRMVMQTQRPWTFCHDTEKFCQLQSFSGPWQLGWQLDSHLGTACAWMCLFLSVHANETQCGGKRHVHEECLHSLYVWILNISCTQARTCHDPISPLWSCPVVIWTLHQGCGHGSGVQEHLPVVTGLKPFSANFCGQPLFSLQVSKGNWPACFAYMQGRQCPFQVFHAHLPGNSQRQEAEPRAKPAHQLHVEQCSVTKDSVQKDILLTHLVLPFQFSW